MMIILHSLSSIGDRLRRQRADWRAPGATLLVAFFVCPSKVAAVLGYAINGLAQLRAKLRLPADLPFAVAWGAIGMLLTIQRLTAQEASRGESVSDRLADLRDALGERARTNEPLAPRTTFRIGGPADLLIEARTLPELIASVRLARQDGVPIFILGNGSNVLVRDGGFRGLVIENHCNQSWLDVTPPGRAVLHAESGASLPGVANRMARQGWAGLEWAIGVPGTIGGAVVGNAGAHGACVADSLLKVSVLDAGNAVRELPKVEAGFDYRTSRFKRAKGDIILSAGFELKRDDPAACLARMNEYIDRRRRTQPTEASVGSMFKNPPNDPSSLLSAGFAGRLIEQAGLKGTRIGNVEVSHVHANFFVNRGGATAGDVLALIELVRERVRQEFGIELELEIEIVGS